MRERTFMRDDKVVSTEVPAAATRLLAQGWREVEVPTERPEPDQTIEAGQIIGRVGSVGGSTGPHVSAETTRRPRRKETTSEPPPPEGLGEQPTAESGQSE